MLSQQLPLAVDAKTTVGDVERLLFVSNVCWLEKDGERPRVPTAWTFMCYATNLSGKGSKHDPFKAYGLTPKTGDYL